MKGIEKAVERKAVESGCRDRARVVRCNFTEIIDRIEIMKKRRLPIIEPLESLGYIVSASTWNYDPAIYARSLSPRGKKGFFASFSLESIG